VAVTRADLRFQASMGTSVCGRHGMTAGGAVRILQLHNRYREPGGEDVAVQAEAALLRAAGHEVLQYEVENPAGPVAAVALLAGAPWNPAAARAVARVVHRVRPDVAHVHNTWFALSPAVMRTLHQVGVPVVMTLHNYRLTCANAQLFRDGQPCELCVGGHSWHGVRHRCYRESALLTVPAAATITVHRRLGTWHRDVDLFLAPNAFARALLIRSGLPATRIRVKPNFVQDPGPRLRPAAASPTVLFVGRLAYQKGIDMLLEAWRRFGGSGLELAVVGDGPLHAEFERCPVPGVRFEGRVDAAAVRAHMLASRALVFPSRSYEVQPLVALEALAAGLPVLASDLGGMPELLEPLGPAWLAPPGDPAGWADALGRLSDSEGVQQGSHRARERYEEAFTPAAAIVALEAAYDRARRAAWRRSP
jgi:glycosyltransferase involved in cell wall biosynthesis